jgi:hypothetical protein
MVALNPTRAGVFKRRYAWNAIAKDQVKTKSTSFLLSVMSHAGLKLNTLPTSVVCCNLLAPAAGVQRVPCTACLHQWYPRPALHRLPALLLAPAAGVQNAKLQHIDTLP